jgi:hypothetical protein
MESNGTTPSPEEVGGAVQRVMNRQLRRIFVMQVAVVLVIVVALGAGFYTASTDRRANRDFQAHLFEDIEGRLISKAEVSDLRSEIRLLRKSNLLLSRSADKLRIRVRALNDELAKPPR